MGAARPHLKNLELALKAHLTSNGGVVPQIEMLTYWRVRSAFNSRNALPLDVIWTFKANSRLLSCVTNQDITQLRLFSSSRLAGEQNLEFLSRF